MRTNKFPDTNHHEDSTTFLSRPISHLHLCSFDMSTDKAARRARFEEASKVIKQELFDYVTGEGMPKDAIEWYDRNFGYNISGGKLNRDMSVVDTARSSRGPH